MRTFILSGAVSAAAISAALADPTYWLPRIERSDTEIVYVYDTELPDALVPHITKRTGRGGGATETREIGGTPYTFVEQFVAWETNNHGPAQDKIAVPSTTNGVKGSDFVQVPGLAQEAQVIAALNGLAKPSDNEWRYADLLVLRQDGTPVPGLRLVEPIPEQDQIKARMRAIAESTVPGQFFPGEVQRPADLDAMRREMLAWGNLMRQDPGTFRADNKYANDFGGDTVTGEKGRETLHKVYPQTPYFDDLVLHPELNEACQWMAEYYAKTNGNAAQPSDKKHNAPGVTYQGADMHTVTTRLEHFAPGVGSSGEGLGGGGKADAYPEGWMTSDTHYRPWFGIDFKTVSMGLGAARTENGWFFCKLGGTELPEGAAQPERPVPGAPAVVTPVSQPAPAPSGTRQQNANGWREGCFRDPLTNKYHSTATGEECRPPAGLFGEGTSWIGKGVMETADAGSTLPAGDPRITVPAGQVMERDRRYTSPEGKFYVVFQTDGNLVVARSSDQAYFWGLNEQPGVDFRRATRAEMRSDGRFVVTDAVGAELWSAPPAGAQAVPDSHLELGDDAVLAVQSSDLQAPPSWATQQRGTLPVTAGQSIPVETQYYSTNGEYLLRFSGRDGNVVVAKADGLGFVWGLNLVPGVDFRSAERLEMRADGRLVASAADGRQLWAVPEIGAVPGARATLSDEGVLQVLAPDGTPTWSSR